MRNKNNTPRGLMTFKILKIYQASRDTSFCMRDHTDTGDR